MRLLLPLVLVAASLQAQSGTYGTMGTGCGGSDLTGHVAPLAGATTWGNSSNAYPFGAYNMRFQQEIDRSEMPLVPQIWHLMALREDTTVPQKATTTISVKVLLGTTTYSSATLTTDYAKNATGAQTKVFDGQMVLPGLPTGNTDLKRFDYVVRFDKPFLYVPLKTTENFLIEVVNSTTNAPRRFPDCFSGASTNGTRLYNGGTTTTTGTLGKNHCLVILFGQNQVPVLGNTGVPTINKAFSVDLDQALASSAAGLVFGASSTAWGPIQLPLDLTPAGAPTCQLLVSFDALLATPTDVNGHGSVQLGLPNDTGLLGVGFHNQFFVLDKAANSLGLSWSNGGSGKIGR